MAAAREMVFVGVKGTVTALDRDNGERVWETALKGSDFVNVMVQGGDLFAASRGRLYRLDPASGDILWLNELPGMGYGIVTIAGASQSAPSAEKSRRDQAAVIAAAGS
jgi:outer membrane protein assembly factor BamB